MKLTVIVSKEGRVAGATVAVPSPETRTGHPSAWLVAGPDQRLVEIEVPDQVVPGPEADGAHIARFLAELGSRIGEHDQKR